MNLYFYPNLLGYQAGSKMAEKVKQENIEVGRIYKFSEWHSWALDFYNREPVKIASLEDLSQKSDVWIYVDDSDLQELHEAGFHWDKQITVDQFRITRLQLKFLEPSTRKKKLSEMHLVHINRAPQL